MSGCSFSQTPGTPEITFNQEMIFVGAHIACEQERSIPAVPIAPWANPRALAFFLNEQIPWGGDT